MGQNKVDIVEFAERVLGVKLLESQKMFIREVTDNKAPIYLTLPRWHGYTAALESIREIGGING